jgi:hypothetical protein
VVIKDNLAYLCEKGAGIRIVNVSDPKNPIPLAIYNTYGGAWDVAVKDNNIYVADYPYGLLVLRYTPPVEAAIPADGGSLKSAADNVQVTISAIPLVPRSTSAMSRCQPLTSHRARTTLVKVGSFFRNSAWKNETSVKPENPYTLTVKTNVTGLTDRQIRVLSLYYWDTDLKRWRKEVSTRLNVETATLTAETTRLGLWGVFYDRDDSYSNIPLTATPEE